MKNTAYILSTILLLSIFRVSLAQSSGYNYVLTVEPLVPVKTDAELEALPDSLKKVTVQYMDGLGRPLQSVQVNFSPSHADLVMPFTYDKLGRTPKEFLPYAAQGESASFRTSALAEQQAFYLNAPNTAHTSAPFAPREFEASPLNRVLRQGFAGETWQLNTPFTVKTLERTNEAGEVKRWRLDENDLWQKISDQAANTLFVTSIRDEHDNEMSEFKNGRGQLLLRKTVSYDGIITQTYFLYNDVGRLAAVIQPEGVKKLEENGWQITQEILDDYAFTYLYDDRGRIIEKKVPSAAPVYLVYNRRNQLVLSQDGEQRKSRQWNFTKYDGLRRTILTGIYTDAVHVTRESLQAFADTHDAQWEERDGSDFEAHHGYTNQAFPVQNTETLLVNYYDNYDYDGDGSPDVAFASDKDFSDVPASDNHTRATGTKTRLLNAKDWLQSIPFYDEDRRVIHTLETYPEGEVRTWSAYDFRGKVTKTKRQYCMQQQVNNNILNHENTFANTRRKKQRRGTPPLSFIQSCLSLSERYEYDHAERPKKTFLRLNEEPELLLSENTYNELGQLLRKDLHRSDTAFLQNVDYAYHIRGWLRSLNDPYLTDKKDLFGMELRYEQGIADLQASGNQNGNISALLWRSQRDTLTRGYGFRYDGLNRLTKGFYAADDGSKLWNKQIDYYGMPSAQYDLNGNLTVLQNQGKTFENTYGPVDQLSYHYKGNRLLAVNDGIGNNLPGNDFRDHGSFGSLEKPEYVYDENGSMTEDGNKGLMITYNHLRLPETIVKGKQTVKYTYDAGGRKLKKETYEGNVLLTSRSYVAGAEYENGKLDFLAHGEGRIDFSKEETPKPRFFYDYRDHLGSVRLTWEAAPEQEQGLLCTMEEGADEEGEYPKFKNVDKTRNEEHAYQSKRSAKLVQEQGPLTTIPVRHGQKFEASVWYVYDPIEIIVLPLKEQEPAPRPRKKKGFPRIGIGISNQARLPDVRGGRKDKNSLPVLNISSTIDLGSKKPEQKDNPNLPSPNAGLRFVLTDTSGNTLHTEVKNVGPLGGSWLKIAHEYVTDLAQYGKAEGKLKIYVENEGVEPLWFDSLYIKCLNLVPKIVQEQVYRPFGSTIADLDYYAGIDSSDYLYNGHERDKITDLIDYGWRQYDPQIGRFFKQDRFSEKYYPLSPYQYAANNPINYIDIKGDSTIWAGVFNWLTNNQQTLGQGIANLVTETANGNLEPLLNTVSALKYVQNQIDRYQNGNTADKTQVVLETATDAVIVGMALKTPRTGATVPEKSANEWKGPKNLNATKSSDIGKTIHTGKQGKHIVGHNNYQSGKSILKSDAQSLLDDFHAGNIKSSRVISESKISVDFGKTIGNYVKDGVSTPTSVGTMINSKTGVHIVPANPIQY